MKDSKLRPGQDKPSKYLENIFKIISIVGIILTILASVWLWKIGAFSSIEKLRQIIHANDWYGPIIFILIQIIQVVIPIIPGGITLGAGVILFGPLPGFIYNYVGIVIGSILLFEIGRVYGTMLVKAVVSEKTYTKYIAMVERNQRKFDITFFLLMLAPLAPDDALVLISSQTEISRKWFLFSILIGKLPSVASYSFIMAYGLDKVPQVWSWLKHLFTS